MSNKAAVKQIKSHQAWRSYSPQMRTNSSRWWGPRIEESRVRYSKLSMITATNRFSIWRGNIEKGLEEETQQKEKLQEYHRVLRTDQEGAEEDEGDEVAVSEVGAAASLVVRRQGEGGDGGVRLTLPTRQTGEHDLLPRLACRAPGGLWVKNNMRLKEEIITLNET